MARTSPTRSHRRLSVRGDRDHGRARPLRAGVGSGARGGPASRHFAARRFEPLFIDLPARKTPDDALRHRQATPPARQTEAAQHAGDNAVRDGDQRAIAISANQRPGGRRIRRRLAIGVRKYIPDRRAECRRGCLDLIAVSPSQTRSGFPWPSSRRSAGSPRSAWISSAVRRARPSGLATMGTFAASGSRAKCRPIAPAWATPRVVRGESPQP